MADVEAALDDAGITNPHVREYVAALRRARPAPSGSRSSTRPTTPGWSRRRSRPASSQPAGEGRYYSRSYHKDTARSEERTIVATSNPEDKGVYNNWRPASEMKPLLEERMRGASAGKTMYVIPYLMSPPGNALAPWADRRRADRHPHRRAAHDPDVARRRGVRQRPRGPGQLRPRRPRHRRPGEPRPGHRPTTSATSSRSPTSARSCTSARRTAATRCSARSPTACARRRTTAGRRRSSSPSSTC